MDGWKHGSWWGKRRGREREGPRSDRGGTPGEKQVRGPAGRGPATRLHVTLAWLVVISLRTGSFPAAARELAGRRAERSAAAPATVLITAGGAFSTSAEHKGARTCEQSILLIFCEEGGAEMSKTRGGGGGHE